MTEEDFRSSPQLRLGLERLLQSTEFVEAWKILTERRRRNEQILEARMDMDPIASVRVNSQRIGAEGVLFDLQALCEPMSPPAAQERETWERDKERAELDQLQNEQAT